MEIKPPKQKWPRYGFHINLVLTGTYKIITAYHFKKGFSGSCCPKLFESPGVNS